MNGNALQGLLTRLDQAHKEEKQFNLETYGAREYDPDEETLHSEAAEAIRELTADAEPWPVPGKPETYSERYMMFHRMLDKDMGVAPLSADEAIEVWNAHHALMGSVPEGGLIGLLMNRLDRELQSGQRCAVCARHSSENYNCSYEC